MTNDWLLHGLGKALYTFEKFSSALDDLMLPTQSYGESTGNRSSQAFSRPPLKIPILDLKMSTQNLLSFWVHVFARELGLATLMPYSRVIAANAAWMQAHLHELVDSPAITVAAEEIIAQAHILDALFTDIQQNVVEGTCRKIATACLQRGHEISKSTIYRWAHDGLISSRVVEGKTLVVLDEVLARL